MRIDTKQENKKTLTLRKNFGWALAGTIVYQGCLWASLIVITKLLSPSDLGRFTLALAVCTPITLFSTMNLRSVQIATPSSKYQFGHFLAFQLISSAVALTTIVLFSLGMGYAADVYYPIIVIGIGQAIMGVRDVFLAYAQKNERMDKVAISKIIAGTLSLLAFTSALFLYKDLVLGLIFMQSARITVLLFWDIPITRRLMRESVRDHGQESIAPKWQIRDMLAIAWIALPLGMAQVFKSLSDAVPKYAIEYFKDLEQLGFFSAILALVMAGSMVTGAAGQSALPRLCRYWEKDIVAFKTLLNKLTCFGAGVGAISILIVFLFGETILRIAYTSEYAEYQSIFTWSMVFGAIWFTVDFQLYGVLATKRYSSISIMQAISMSITGALSLLWIPQYGLKGAVWAMLASQVVQGVLAVVINARSCAKEGGGVSS